MGVGVGAGVGAGVGDPPPPPPQAERMTVDDNIASVLRRENEGKEGGAGGMRRLMTGNIFARSIKRITPGGLLHR